MILGGKRKPFFAPPPASHDRDMGDGGQPAAKRAKGARAKPKVKGPPSSAGKTKSASKKPSGIGQPIGGGLGAMAKGDKHQGGSPWSLLEDAWEKLDSLQKK